MEISRPLKGLLRRKSTASQRQFLSINKCADGYGFTGDDKNQVSSQNSNIRIIRNEQFFPFTISVDRRRVMEKCLRPFSMTWLELVL